eukprot:2421502-Pleurochrysis_carterae.AAC.1
MFLFGLLPPLTCVSSMTMSNMPNLTSVASCDGRSPQVEVKSPAAPCHGSGHPRDMPRLRAA